MSDSGRLSAGGWLAALLLIASGACLLIGFLTPFASLLTGLGALGIDLGWLPAAAWTLFDSRLATAEMVAISVAIAMLGPGAISLDCHLFGRREIVIPPAANQRDN